MHLATFRRYLAVKPFGPIWAILGSIYGMIPNAKLFRQSPPASPTTFGVVTKQLLIIVKRGHGVDYKVKQDEPLADFDMRHDFPGQKWEDIGWSVIWDPELLGCRRVG